MVSQRTVLRLAGLSERRGVPAQMSSNTANTEAAPIAICCRKSMKKGESIWLLCNLQAVLATLRLGESYRDNAFTFDY
jgi:hypothetical protein